MSRKRGNARAPESQALEYLRATARLVGAVTGLVVALTPLIALLLR